MKQTVELITTNKTLTNLVRFSRVYKSAVRLLIKTILRDGSLIGTTQLLEMFRLLAEGPIRNLNTIFDDVTQTH